MLRRARRALGETASRTLGTVWGGTFHSVANRLLRTYGEAIGLDPDFTVMDQSDAEDLMDASRHNLALGSKEKRFPRKQTCLSIYSRCVNSSDRLDHTLAAFFPWCIEWEQELRLLFKSYTEAKQERHVLDYDDLLLYWFHLLGDQTLVTLLNERFDHILVDEYQDTNRLLHRMRSLNHNLAVVSDDAQSIYSFRAAELRNILDFPAEFPGATVVTLETNYRSSFSVSWLAGVSHGSNLRLELEPAAALGMRAERGLDERDAARALIGHRRPQRQRIGRRARLPRR
jgi:DNA helicase-2/ATP-dependent DNA helicase PcrA